MPTTWGDHGPAITLANNNTTATGSGTGWNSVRATLANSTGKRYFEQRISASDPYGGFVALGDAAMLLTSYPGASGNSGGYDIPSQGNGASYASGSFAVAHSAPGVVSAPGDVFQVAVDLDAGKAWLGKNNVWLFGGNPITGANPWLTFAPGTPLYPVAAFYTGGEGNTLLADGGTYQYIFPVGFLPWGEAGGIEEPPVEPEGSTHCINANVGTGSYATASAPGGRLTGESCTPIMRFNHPEIRTLYYTPYVTSRAPLCNGTTCADRAIPQLSFDLSETHHPANNTYDLFLFELGGAPKLVSSPAWPNATQIPPWARGMTDGIETNLTEIEVRHGTGAGDVVTAPIGTATFIGTIRTVLNGATQWMPHPKPVTKAPGRNGYALGIWNAYNREDVGALVGDGAFSWTYASGNPRFANDNPNMRLWWVDGRGKSAVKSRYDTTIVYAGQSPSGASAATVMDWQPGDYFHPHAHALSQGAFVQGNTGTPLPSMATVAPQIGWHYFAAIEYATPVVVEFEGTQFSADGNQWLCFSGLSLDVKM
jgi:hypothetical protein